MTRLDDINNEITDILEREVSHLHKKDVLDAYQIKSLETLNKILGVLQERSGLEEDPYKEASTEELLEDFK